MPAFNHSDMDLDPDVDGMDSLGFDRMDQQIEDINQLYEKMWLH